MISQDTLHLALASSGIALVTTDKDRKVTLINSVAETLTGWSCSEARGKSLDDIFRIVNANTREPAFDPVAHVLLTREKSMLANHTVLLSRHGAEHHIADSATPILSKNGNIEGVALVFRDVTEEYAQREQLREERKLMEHVLKTTGTGINIVDGDFNLHFVNKGWHDVYGDPTGRKCHEYFKGRNEPCSDCGVPQALSTKKVVVSEEVLPKESNKIVEVHSIPFQDAAGKWLAAELNVDITLRKKMQEDLRESQEHLAATLRSIGDGVIACDAAGVVTSLNAVAEALTGWTCAEAVGKPIGEVFRIIQAQTRDTAENPVFRSIQEGVIVGLANHTALIAKDGTEYQIADSCAPIRDMSGKVSGAVLVFRDVTEEYAQREALRQSEADLKEAQEIAKMGRWDFDHFQNCLQWSESVYAIFGLDKNVFSPSYEAFVERIHPSDRSKVDRIWKGAIKKKKEVYKVDHRIIVGDDESGEVRWVSEESRTEYDHAGNPVRTTGIVMDITERKRQEEAIRVFKTASDHANYGIGFADLDGTILYINRYFANVHGYEPDEIIGKELAQFHTKNQIPSVKHSNDTLINEGSFPPTEIWHVHLDGHEFPMLMSGVLIRDEEGQPSYMATSAIDLTDYHQAQNEMRHLEKMAAVGQLAAGIAHNFNNQLTGVIGYGNMLRAKLEDPELKRYVENLLTGARRSAELTRQLVAFSRVEGCSPVNVDAHRILQEVVGVLSHSLPSNIQMKKTLLACPSMIHADSGQIQNAILNLAFNARDAMPDGGELSFETSVKELDDSYCQKLPYEVVPGTYLCLSVTDTGTGIAPDVLPRIFDPFFTTKDVGEGMGMGLATAYGTIKSHKGAMEVNSDIGKGTTFKLYIPLAESADPVMPQSREPRHAPRPATVLLVDDEAIVRAIGEDMLVPLGYDVVTAGDGVEGLEHFRNHHDGIDLVILDMMMPQMGGRDTFREMRKIKPDQKAVIASGYSINDEGRQLLAEGALGFIQKPFDIVELSTILHNVLIR